MRRPGAGPATARRRVHRARHGTRSGDGGPRRAARKDQDVLGTTRDPSQERETSTAGTACPVHRFDDDKVFVGVAIAPCISRAARSPSTSEVETTVSGEIRRRPVIGSAASGRKTEACSTRTRLPVSRTRNARPFRSSAAMTNISVRGDGETFKVCRPGHQRTTPPRSFVIPSSLLQPAHRKGQRR